LGPSKSFRSFSRFLIGDPFSPAPYHFAKHFAAMLSSQAPIDFIRKGKLATGEEVGLELLKGYAVRVVTLR